MQAAAVALAASLNSRGAPPCGPASFAIVSGFDLYGGDLPGQPVSKTLSNASECAALCCTAAAAGCAAFSLNAGGPGTRWCYLKAASGWSNASTPGVDSGALPPVPPNRTAIWWNASVPTAQRVAALVSAMTTDEQISWLNDASPAIPRLGLPAFEWEGEASHGIAWAGVATVFPSPIALGASFDVELTADVGRAIAIEARAKWIDARTPDGGSPEFYGLSFMVPNLNVAVVPQWGRAQETFGESATLTSQLGAAFIRALQFDDACEFGCSTYVKMLAVAKHVFAYHIESYGADGQYRLSHCFNVTPADFTQTYVAPFRAAALVGNVSFYMCEYGGTNGTNPTRGKPSGPEPWGVPSCLHPLMDATLRAPPEAGGFGWSGSVISDEGSITFAGPGYHGYTSSVVQAACLALNAGTDLALGGEYSTTLRECLASGAVAPARVAQAATRVFTSLMSTGWFDTLAALAEGTLDPVPYNAVAKDIVGSPAHLALAKRAAAAGLVLLKNEQRVLPLSPAAVRGGVALIGPGATFSGTATSSYLGNYAGCEEGPGGTVTDDPRCTIVDLRAALAAAAAVGGWPSAFAPGVSSVNDAKNQSALIAEAAAAAAAADVVILALALDTCQESYCSEGEANDRARGHNSIAATLDFPGAQLELAAAVAAARKPGAPLVVVVLAGSVVSSPTVYTAADAVLLAWYPGVKGGAAIADALLGAQSPAGRLPMTVVSDESEVPDVRDFSLATPPGRTFAYYSGTPLYPFGFGLSFASFSYSGLSVTPGVLAPGDASFTASATLSRASVDSFQGAADEVAMLFASFTGPLPPAGGCASVPRLQLLAFTRVANVSAGASVPISFEVTRDALALVDDASCTLAVSAGSWQLWLGGGPPSAGGYPGGTAPLKGGLTIK
jgi:beta-glucosidase